MKRRYKISLEDKTYEVDVEEVEGTSVMQAPFPSEAAQPRPAPSVSPQPTPKVQPAKMEPAAPGLVKAPLPGKVLSIAVKPGDKVKLDQVILVLESMKMENDIYAPKSGEVKEVKTSVGATVATGDILVVID